MILLLRDFIGWMVGVFGSREDLILENLALRQQLLALHSKRPRHYRPCTSCSGLLCETLVQRARLLHECGWTSGRNHDPRFDTIRGQAFWLGYAGSGSRPDCVFRVHSWLVIDPEQLRPTPKHEWSIREIFKEEK